MNSRIRVELSVMMFLEFFVWGAWFVTLGTYLGKIGFSGMEIGSAYSTTAWAAIVAPFFVGMIADRFFPAQVVLGVMHLLGAVLMFAASRVTSPGMFFIVLLGYALCYMPTLALVNAISFNQMSDPAKQFPSIRVLGTIGWIVAGVLVSRLKVEATAQPMQLAACVSVLMGLYSFFLPNTPPKSTGKKVTVGDVLGLDALRLMKDPSFTVFVLGSLFVCIPLAFYYAFTNLFLNEVGVQYAASKQSLGQVSEVVFMLVMPFFFARLGVKKMLLLGMGAWAARYVLFAFGNPASLMWMFYGGILLHGVCYDFFFVTGQIYVDKKAPKEVQASAQGFIALITYGVGMVIGNFISGKVVDFYTVVDAAGVKTHHWVSIWMVPAIMAGVVILGFALLFKDDKDGGVSA